MYSSASGTVSQEMTAVLSLAVAVGMVGDDSVV
jgi:hypothetical protein